VDIWKETKATCTLARQVTGRNMLVKAIDALIGMDIAVRHGDKGAKFLSIKGSLADQYRSGKDGD
ncbi:hypothetical protein ACFL3Y_01410, partial [Pseudomonadota bacterium]